MHDYGETFGSPPPLIITLRKEAPPPAQPLVSTRWRERPTVFSSLLFSPLIPSLCLSLPSRLFSLGEAGREVRKDNAEGEEEEGLPCCVTGCITPLRSSAFSSPHFLTCRWLSLFHHHYLCARGDRRRPQDSSSAAIEPDDREESFVSF